MPDRLLPRRLSALDAMFLYGETDEAPMHIGGVDVIDGDLSSSALVARLEARLPEAPRYLQRVTAAPLGLGHPVWEDDPDFDVRRHVFDVTLPPPGDEGALQACAARLFGVRLDRGRPLWELHVVHGLEGDRSAVVAKIHHCMVDGVSGVELMNILFDATPDGAPAPQAPRVRTLPPAGAQELVREAIGDAASRLLGSGLALARATAALPETLRGVLPQVVGATAALRGAAKAPVTRLPFNRPLSGVRRLGWTTIPLDEVKAVARAGQGTTNDVVLAILTDAIARMLSETGVDVRSRWLRILVPVNVRHPDETGVLGNRVSMIPVEVPLDATPLDRLTRTTERTRVVKHAGVAEAVERAAEAGEFVPAALYAAALAVAASPSFVTWSAPLRTAPFLTANLVCTNVPGPPVPVYGLGHRVLAHYPLVPLGFDTGLNCAVLTYNRVLHVCLVADAAALDDLGPLTTLLRASFEDLRAAACASPSAGQGAHAARPEPPEDSHDEPVEGDGADPAHEKAGAATRRRARRAGTDGGGGRRRPSRHRTGGAGP